MIRIDGKLMAPVLTFERQAGDARELVRLGEVQIGELVPPYVRCLAAAYLLELPDLPRAFRPACDVDTARRAIIRLVEEWLTRLGVLYPGQPIEARGPDGRTIELTR